MNTRLSRSFFMNNRLFRSFFMTCCIFIALAVFTIVIGGMWLLALYTIDLITPWVQLHAQFVTNGIFSIVCFCVVWAVIYIDDLKIN